MFDQQGACHTFTIMRYHVFMTMFTTMLVEAIHLFRKIVLVFGAERSFRSAYVTAIFGTLKLTLLHCIPMTNSLLVNIKF